jgi:hypothetical protein
MLVSRPCVEELAMSTLFALMVAAVLLVLFGGLWLLLKLIGGLFELVFGLVGALFGAIGAAIGMVFAVIGVLFAAVLVLVVGAAVLLPIVLPLAFLAGLIWLIARVVSGRPTVTPVAPALPASS